MSFVTERRLFNRDVKASMLSGYFLDFLSLGAIWMAAVFCIPELRSFLVQQNRVVAPPSSVAERSAEAFR